VSQTALQFSAPNSESLLALLHNEAVHNATFSCSAYNVHFDRPALVVHIKLDAATAQDAATELFAITARLKERGLFAGALTDDDHIQQVLGWFCERNFVSRAPYTTWECVLGSGQTRIRPSSVHRRIELQDGSAQSVMASVEFTLPSLSGVHNAKAVREHLNGLFETLNQEQRYTVYLRQLGDVASLLLPDSESFSLSCSVAPSTLGGPLAVLAVPGSLLTWSQRPFCYSDFPFMALLLDFRDAEVAKLEIMFDDEEQRDALCVKLGRELHWTLLHED
jgi:hypothetical protein